MDADTKTFVKWLAATLLVLFWALFMVSFFGVLFALGGVATVVHGNWQKVVKPRLLAVRDWLRRRA